LTLERLGTWVFLLVVLGVALAIALSFGMNAAADDLRAQVAIAAGQSADSPRTVWGDWLSGRMAADLDPADTPARLTRAADLDHRADRIRELAGAASLAGLVLAFVTARPDTRRSTSESGASALANTRSNGTV
jgi:HAMP domain-containing protein